MPATPRSAPIRRRSRFYAPCPGSRRACATAIKSTPLATGRQLAEAADARRGADPGAGRRRLPGVAPHHPRPAAGPVRAWATSACSSDRRSPSSAAGTTPRYGADRGRGRSATLAARAGLVVVSGMARGLDAVAHVDGARRGRDHDRRARQRARRHLPRRQPRALRAGDRRRTAADRVPARRAPARRQLPPPQPADQRPRPGHARGRGRARLGRADHRRHGAGPGSRGHGRARSDHQRRSPPAATASSATAPRPYLEPADLAQLYPEVSFPSELPAEHDVGTLRRCQTR